MKKTNLKGNYFNYYNAPSTSRYFFLSLQLMHLLSFFETPEMKMNNSNTKLSVILL